MIKTLKKYLRIYWLYFKQYWKTRLIYKSDFLIGFISQLINLTTSLVFLTLLFTQVESINGWSFNQMLFLAAVGGIIMNTHHIFFFNIYSLEEYIIGGDFDRFRVRPLNPLFQVYADGVSDNNLSKLIVNIALFAYASSKLNLTIFTLPKMIYGFFALISGILVFASIYLAFATTSFWTGKSRSAIWLIFQITDYRRYPYSIYPGSIKIILITLIPIAFASFFPATFFLEKSRWSLAQFISLIAGPVFFLVAYSFWKFGMKHYSSTGS